MDLFHKYVNIYFQYICKRLIFLIVLYHLITKTGSNISGFKDIRWGYRMTNSLIDIEERVSFLDCVEECLSRTRCKSINYKRSGLWCEMNYNSLISSVSPGNIQTDILEEDKTFLFLDMKALDKKMAGACARHTCSLNERCVRKSLNQAVCEIIDCNVPSYANMNIVTTNTKYETIGIGSRWKVQCKDGFFPVDTTAEVTCLLNGTWTDPGFRCQKCECDCSWYRDRTISMTVNEERVNIPVVLREGQEWIVIQRRCGTSVDFSRSWQEYEAGFGNQRNEFWIGNKNIHNITYQGMTVLTIEMEDYDGQKHFASYNSFIVDDSSRKYKLHLSKYTGSTTWPDSFGYHNNLEFTTYDNDNDKRKTGNCALLSSGGWWFNRCLPTNLNGKYGVKNFEGIIWNKWSSLGNIIYVKNVQMLVHKP